MVDATEQGRAGKNKRPPVEQTESFGAKIIKNVEYTARGHSKAELVSTLGLNLSKQKAISKQTPRNIRRSK